MNRNEDISQEEWERAESYLLNTLPPDERTRFEQKLSADEALRASLAELRLLLMGVNETVLHEKMQSFHQALPATAPARQMNRYRFSVPVWIAAASVVLVLLLAGWFFLLKEKSHERLFADYFKPDPGLITAMSATDNYVFEKAMIDYKQGNYAAAIQAWDSLQKLSPENDTLTYFLGVAHLANKEAASAIPYLQQATVKESFFQDDAWWYLGLALLKEGEWEKAIQVLEKSTHEGKEGLVGEIRRRKG